MFFGVIFGKTRSNTKMVPTRRCNNPNISELNQNVQVDLRFFVNEVTVWVAPAFFSIFGTMGGARWMLAGFVLTLGIILHDDEVTVDWLDFCGDR